MSIDGQPMFKVLDKVKVLENLGREILHFKIGDPEDMFPFLDREEYRKNLFIKEV